MSIQERPPEAEDRAVPGHWEEDLLAGSASTRIVTLVERHSRFVMLVKVDGKDAETVVAALARQVRSLPAQLRSTMTCGRGMKLAPTSSSRSQVLASTSAARRARGSGQRASNENTDGLLRQYVPRKPDVSIYSRAPRSPRAESL